MDYFGIGFSFLFFGHSLRFAIVFGLFWFDFMIWLKFVIQLWSKIGLIVSVSHKILIVHVMKLFWMIFTICICR